MTKKKPILIAEYSPLWPEQFQQLRDIYQNYLGQYLVGIEHVGSTSVPGLAAKPVLDIDLIVADVSALEIVVPILEFLEYEYKGEVGIVDRHVFTAKTSAAPNNASGMEWPHHHLYCCIQGSTALRNHLLLRDQLRTDPLLANAYRELKRGLAESSKDMGEYVDGKTMFITGILKRSGLTDEELVGIVQQNKNTITATATE